MNYESAGKDQFLALFQRLPVAGILVQVSDNNVLAINPAFEHLFGWKSEQVVNHPSGQLPVWLDTQQRKHLLEALARDGSVQQFESRFRCHDGKLKPCLVYIEQLEVNGELCRLSMVHDMSERIAAEQALRDSEAKFTALFRDAPEPYALFDKRTARVLEVNKRFTELFGYKPVDVIGKTALQIGLWVDPSKRPAIINQLLKDGYLRNQSAELYTASKHIIECEVSSSFVKYGNKSQTLTSFKDVTEQKRIEAQVKHLAYHDALTDLPNRLLLNDRIEQHLGLGERHGLSCALLFFDLDHFKHINDSLGHSNGDAVLQEVSQRLLSQVRKSDTVARLGGDEFVVFLTGLSGDLDQVTEQARTSAEKLLASVAAPMQIQGHNLQLGCSIGIALAPAHCNSAEDLLKYADTALYGVKANGRNAIALFEPHMQVIASQRLQLETELREAQQRQQFTLHYQAQIDARAQRIIGAEALLRWQHPTKGIINPGLFMPVLEDSGMILEVGHWVLRESCRVIASLIQTHAVDPDQFSLSINISPRQFRQSDFVQQVAAAVSDQGIPAQCLKLEITESMMLQNINDTVAKMHQLRAMGIHFAIDDFGTGYSSLSYLKRLPVDLLKIDQSFIRDCTHDSNDAEIVRAIIAMARSLKLELIAEGVETPEQLGFLQQLDCHAYQGYLFSPAVPEQAFVQQLQSMGESMGSE
ncbi:MAG: bifunctional diguanylate cyclase/phosphodiesterase [Pseudomonadaceae bacterium]|nr:MAG: bifunctional diguanylate cyclase/phosphodiesterase [Pseudomonadaceae bacterium]